MKFNTVIFDFDGTVADTNKLIIDSWQHTYRVLTGREQDEDILKATFGEPLAISLENAFPDVPVDESINIYREHQLEIYEELIEPFNGMPELIKLLKEKGYKVGLLTSRLKPSTMIGLEKFGIVSYFDSIITLENCTKHKPDPEPMLVALKSLEAKPEEAIMIGDSLFDIRCAHNAGVEAALVSWAVALSDPPTEGEDKPEYILNKAEDLLEVIA